MKKHRELTVADLLRDAKENPHILEIYAKHNCRHCLGRGHTTTNIHVGNGRWADQKTVCQCVIKTMKKELAADA